MKTQNDSKRNLMTVSAYLVSLMCVMGTMLACGDRTADDHEPNTSPTETASGITEAVTAENGRSNVKDTLPETMDFGKETVKVLARGGDLDTKSEFFSEKTTGDVVNDAVFARNKAVEERLNISLEIVLHENATRHGQLGDSIRAAVMADSDEFDVIANAMYNQMPLAIEGFFMDLNSVEYIDFTQPWWNETFAEMTEFEGRNYVCMGELSQTMISGTFAMFFNKTMFDEFYPNEPSLYETVSAGAWTMDRLIAYSTPMYADLNGNGQADEYDRYGNYFRDGAGLTLGADAFAGGCNVKMLVRADDGSYIYNGTGEKTADFVEKMTELLFENNNTMRWSYDDITVMVPMLHDQALFTTWMLTAVNYLRDMEDDYGIIPMPKLDEAQENYTTFCHDGSTAFSLPVTANQPDMLGAFLEAMAAETYRIVTPAYFETALKGKYSRDDETSQMLDLIVGSVYLDVGYIYGQNLGTPAPIDTIRLMLREKANCQKAASTFKAEAKSILNHMETILDQYSQIET